MYEARQRADELGLAEHELVVTRAQLDELRDHVAELDDVLTGLYDDLEVLVALAPDDERLRAGLERVVTLREDLGALLVDGSGTPPIAGNPRSVK